MLLRENAGRVIRRAMPCTHRGRVGQDSSDQYVHSAAVDTERGSRTRKPWHRCSRMTMDTVRDLLTSLGLGVSIAVISLLFRIRRRQKENAILTSAFIEQHHLRMEKYREPGRVTEFRSLSESELRLFEYFLCEADVGPGPFCDQVHRVAVEARCPCGCPSIDVAIAGEPEATEPIYPVAEYWWPDEQGRRNVIFPSARGAGLSGLQVYSLDGDEHPRELPNIPDLERFAR
jgi:hypothetical protein